MDDTLLYATNNYYSPFIQVHHFYTGKILLDIKWRENKLGRTRLEQKRISAYIVLVTAEIETGRDKTLHHFYFYDLRTGKELYKDLSNKMPYIKITKNSEGKRCIYRCDYNEKFKESNVLGIFDEKNENVIWKNK
jgi:hypothetical protein